MSIVYLNGEYLPAGEACVSVFDRGFLFGDGVYEVIPAYGGRLFRLEAHLHRLGNSLSAIRIENPFDHTEWQEILETLLQQHGGSDQAVYLQITRGVSPKRDHAFPDGIRPTVFASASPVPPAAKDARDNGISAITLDDIRWQMCHIKAITLLPNVLLKQQAREAGSDEAILIRDGEATEGAASNLFIVEEDRLVTPPTGPCLLPGITRDLVLELARANDVPCREEAISRERLAHADEVWLTSSTREIMPVCQLDGRPVGLGRPGPVWRRLRALYQDYKEKVRRGEAT